MTSTEAEDRAWESLGAHLRRIETLSGIQATLGWDEQTMLPEAGSALRGRQQALLAGLHHEAVADPRVGDWLDVLTDSEEPLRRACVRNLRRQHERARRVPATLVEELARARSAGFATWVEARKKRDFESFRPRLEVLLELGRRRSACIDPGRPAYDVALDDYDPGLGAAGLRPLFERLAAGLAPLRAAIAERPPLPALGGRFPVAAQWPLHREVAAALGYELGGGRLDAAEHPFTSGHGPGDVRITTHPDEGDLLFGLGGTIHETGHALYEQGLPHRLAGTTVAQAASMGLHESQSRFWENFIGRSQAFCHWLAPRIRAHLPGFELDGEGLYRASNRVAPGLVRVRADEVGYDLHIVLRFELELALFEGRLAPAELPEAWRQRSRELLGIEPADDAEGVLQDVHWAGGHFGYFPSYTLGNLWAASLGATLEAELPGLWEGVERGDFAPVLEFLRSRIHRRGHEAEAPQILADAVGERDPVEDLLARLWARHGALHGVERPDPRPPERD